ncbi:MAG: phosphoenolpyruvate carboxykinase (ATP) [Actinobacteria bacterium]|nr:phosphoenolpyruvate carboxykinase (ATP) [Actinomycetota bacterium]
MGDTLEICGVRFDPGKVIDNPSDQQLREWSLEQGGVISQAGNLAVTTKVRSRSAKFTEIFHDRIPEEGDLKLIREAFDYLKDKEVIRLDRRMCMHPDFRFHARVYITNKYARIPLMWGNTLFEPDDPDGDPDFVTITIAEWPERRVFVFPEEGLTIILGSDYKGENKKATLRQLMYAVKKRGCLGLHAGSKIVRLMQHGELTDVGFLFFGLSGTGKTSLSCHSHWLVHPERIIIRQDDVVILRPDGSALGTESSMYVKTDGLDLETQPLLYSACLSRRTILENVMVHEGSGYIDFQDCSITSNGRAMVKRGDVAFTDDQIDLPKVHNIVFITRRQDVVPPIAKLSPEFGAAAFMLGESIETSAGDPTMAGRAIRVVGTNPFIVGSEAEEGNIFLSILRRNPDIDCYMINTGQVGATEGLAGENITVRDSVKIIEMIAREEIKWKEDTFWGYEVPEEIPGMDYARFDLSNFYQPDEIYSLKEALRKERIEWLERFDGLDPDIINAIRGG